MVDDFPNDPMHLIFLGNCKKLLEEYIKGSSDVRLPQADIESISERMVAIGKYVPKEMARKPRSLIDLPRFKATEFHLFLSYIGPVVLKDILPRELLQHFCNYM